MKRALLVTRGMFGVLGGVQIVLGVLLWTGHAMSLASLHMTLGFLFVLALWTLVILCARLGAPVGLVAVSLLWGLVLPGLGMSQTSMVPGASHWVIRVAHLLTALVAMGLGGALTARTRGSARGGARTAGPAKDPKARVS